MNKLLVALSCCTVFLTGCNPQNQPDSAKTVWEGETVVTVNGTPITEEVFTLITNANRGAPVPRDRLLDDLIKQELLYQEAVRKNLRDNPDVSKRLTLVTQSILSQAAMQDFLANSPITDADIQAAYDREITSGGLEYKASHILTKSEDDAKAVIKKLDNGGNFSELAKQHSIGPSAPKGGDLGWFNAQQMVPPFSQAVVVLKDGAYSKEPVQTQFGWHVIYRENSRPVQPPPLESVKAKLKAKLQKEKIDQYLEKLKTAATIVMAEKPADNTSTPAAAGAVSPTPSESTQKPDNDTSAEPTSAGPSNP